MSAQDMQHLFSPQRLLGTEICTLIGLMVKAPLNLTVPESSSLQSYIQRSDALLELHHAISARVICPLDPRELHDHETDPFEDVFLGMAPSVRHPGNAEQADTEAGQFFGKPSCERSRLRCTMVRVGKSQPDFHMTTQRLDDSLRPGVPASATFRRLSAERDDPEETLPATGTVDDDDDPNDEHEGENEARERGEEDTELPEELETDDEDDLGHPEDDDADQDDDEDEDEDG